MKIRTLISTLTSTLTSALIIALAVSTSALAADKVKVGIAAEPYPPFASPDSDGQWVGWEIEIIDAVCAAAKLDCELKPVAWDGIIPSLTGGQIDVIMASMSITEERAKTIDFSNHYYNTPAVIVADKNLKVEATPDSLKGKIVGIQASTIHQAYAQKYFSDSSTIKTYQTQDEANQDLVNGRIDATQADSIAMSDFINSDAGKCCEIKGSVAKDEEILGKGVGAGLRKGEKDLMDSINAGIAAILEDGTYEKITAEHFETSIYGE